jgi:hypothetical protein
MKLNYKTPLLLLLLVVSVSYLYKSYLNDKKTIKIQPTETTTVLVIDKNSSKSPTPKVSESIRSRVNYLGVGSNWQSR